MTAGAGGGGLARAPLRVLIVSWEYPPLIEGGLGRHVHKLSEALAAGGVEVHVLTRGEEGIPAAELRGGVHVHRVSAPPFSLDLDAFLDWVASLNRDMAALGRAVGAPGAVDLVHSHDWLVAEAAEGIARGGAIPWLVTVHATEYGRHQGWVNEHPQSHIHGAECAMAQHADQLITCSDYMSRHVADVLGVPRSKITVIPNGIDPRDLERIEPDLAAVRARFAEPDERLVMMVGRLMHEKGFQLALDALARIVAARERDAGSRAGVRWVIAGSGLSLHDLQRQAQRLALDRCGSFLGAISDELLHSLYRVADVCVVPSLYEPFGIVPLEAMASGCLCVVADTGGLREVVPADGSAGLRFPAGDVHALRDVLELALTDEALRARVTAGAREYVRRYTWSSIALQTREIYEALVHP